jgi:hypothetical protein
MNIYFETIVGDELKNNISQDEFKSTVTSILDDNLGWKQYGYKFAPVKSDKSDKLNKSDKSDTNILKINLRSGEETNKICTGLSGLSCTRFKKGYDPIDITINYDNWIGGSKSKLSIDDYHRYVINHEVGHWLGLDHTECPIEECKKRGYKDCPASIMQQMSKGPDHVAPCIESCRPLTPNWIIDDPKKSQYRFIKENQKNQKNKKNKYKIITIILILVIIIIIIIAILIISLFKKNIINCI